MDRPDRTTFPTLPRRPIRVVLDGVQRLPNIGTMFRLADAFRVERLHICGFDLQPHKRKLRTATSGTMRWVPWDAGRAAAEVVGAAKDEGYLCVVVELAPGSVPPHELRSDRPLCLVLGAERRGVSGPVLHLADQRIAIPMAGMGNSINLTTAAAIVLYEASRRFPLP